MREVKGPDRIWAALYRWKLVRARMPFWRVVIDAKLDRRARPWPRGMDCAVAAVFVWARTIEEAEGLAALAIEAEGLKVMTADALKCPPAAPPQRTPAAVARTALAFIQRGGDAAPSAPPPRRDARA